MTTSSVIVGPDDRYAVPLAGGKAVGLARLAEAGFRVPRWFCVRADISDAALSDASKEVELAVAALDGERFAVRSSACDEDGSTHSFAGQLETFLDIEPQDVLARIHDVRHSAKAERVTTYRAGMGLAADAETAVIIQEMVAPKSAGVAFSRDPLDGSDAVVISAVAGLGERLVSGAEDGDTLRVSAQGDVLSRSGDAVLTVAEALVLARLARDVEIAMGGPQDLEWALSEDLVYVLQARPITASAHARIIWDNNNIAESYGGVNSALTFSFAQYAYAKAYRRMLEVLQVPVPALAVNSDALERLLGLVHGRMYYHLVNWYRLLALLPGFRFNRPFMERMMGVDDGLPPAVLETLTSGRRERLGDFFAMLRMVGALVYQHITLRRNIATFSRWFDATLAEGIDLRAATDAQIVAEFRELEGRLAHRWDTPLVNDFLTMIFFGLLCTLCKRWCDDIDGTLQNELLATCGGMISTEPAARIFAMGAMAAADSELVDALIHAEAGRIVELTGAVPDLAEQIESYIERFGDRCESELKLESITLRIDAIPLYRAIGRTAQRAPAPDARPVDRDAKNEARVRQKLGRRTLRAAVFAYVLRNARDRIRDRENLRFLRTRLFGRIRSIFREIGARASDRGILAAPADIFHLDIEQALRVLETTDAAALREVVAARATAAAADAARPAPAHRVVTLDGRIIESEPVVAGGSDDTVRKGVGCCAGIVRGRVHVVLDPSEPFSRGDILVTERTDPSWVMLFPAAAGIIVERGSLLSHAAIVSREMGIPSIVAIGGLMTWLRTGDMVEFDGATGVIRRIEAVST